METVKVDLLVIGDIICRSYAVFSEAQRFVAAANTVDMSEEIPNEAVINGIRYDLTNAIVVETISGKIEVDKIIVQKGKNVLASGRITAKGLWMK